MKIYEYFAQNIKIVLLLGNFPRRTNKIAVYILTFSAVRVEIRKINKVGLIAFAYRSRTGSNQYGYRKYETNDARVLSATIENGNSKNEIRRRVNIGKK